MEDTEATRMSDSGESLSCETNLGLALALLPPTTATKMFYPTLEVGAYAAWVSDSR